MKIFKKNQISEKNLFRLKLKTLSNNIVKTYNLNIHNQVPVLNACDNNEFCFLSIQYVCVLNL